MRSNATARCILAPLPGISASAIGRAALDLLLPPHCAACDSRVATAGLLCGACFTAASFIAEPCCARCGVGFTLAGPDVCEACAEAPPPFRQARAALTYDDQARRLILPFKHADRTELARVLAPHMARAGAALLRRADVLIPVPLHRRRLFTRRYNQAVLLAVALGRAAGRPVLRDSLCRVRPTRSLDDRSAAERAAEVAGAFAVRPGHAGRFAGRQVLLVDDVMTSGATTSACTAALLAAGAAAVDVLVAARVPVRS